MRAIALANLAILVAAALISGAATAEDIKPRHGIAMHGDVKYGPDFKHFDYVNPNAPKGGSVRQASIGTFDSFNPFIVKGSPAAGVGFLFETLLTNSADEAFTEYGLLAESIEMPEDRSWVTFNLRPEARWHDGKPVTPEDVIFSLETLKAKGRPFYRFYYGNVAKAEKTGPRQVRFTFASVAGPAPAKALARNLSCNFTLDSGINRELPLIIGQMSILPAHYWASRDFNKTTLEPPIGSGPYKVKAFEPGRSVTLERDPDYWGRDIPVNKGRHNFNTMRFDYYRDSTVALEAFKAGEYDFRRENISKNWATAYDAPPVKQGLIKKEEIRHELPTGMQAFVFNTRRAMFKDPRVRQALAHAFDFEWTNKNLFYGQYARTRNYFSNSELAARGLPEGREKKILECFKDKIPAAVFTTEYNPPTSDGSGNIRSNLRQALKLLRAAGWEVKDGKLTETATGNEMAFEILLQQPTWERIALPFKRNLKRLGVEARVRTVDTAQHQTRTETFDFDMIVDGFGQSQSPGNEQRDYWGSDAAAREGGRNTIGIKDPVIDALAELVIAAPDRQALIERTRALDRVLLWGHYVIPHWHIQAFRVAYWDKFGRPAKPSKNSLGFDTWWIDAAKEKALEERRKSQ